jgi:hypothetical protein
MLCNAEYSFNKGQETVMNQAEIFQCERARGASIGATIVGGFGAAWLAMGITGAGVPVQVALAVVVPVFALIAGLGSVVRRRLLKIAGEETPEKKQMMRIFAVVNVVQWLAIFGTVNVLRNLHLDAWVIPSIVMIVGAHFIPLARIFQAPQHLKTGIAMMLCAAMALVLPGSIRDAVECVAAGLILWVSAAGALHAAFRMTPRPPLAAQAGL